MDREARRGDEGGRGYTGAMAMVARSLAGEEEAAREMKEEVASVCLGLGETLYASGSHGMDDVWPSATMDRAHTSTALLMSSRKEEVARWAGLPLLT